VYENSGASFTNAYDLNMQKYTSLIQAVKHRHRCIDVTVHGFIFGSWDSFHHGHLYIRYQLGIHTLILHTYLETVWKVLFV
jgi:hypothetical protein